VPTARSHVNLLPVPSLVADHYGIDERDRLPLERGSGVVTKRPVATVSVDLDPVDLHLASLGHRSLARDPLVYYAAVPRLLDLCARCGVRMTMFVVARDATAHRSLLARVAAAGHEVASHSLTHPLGLARMTGEALRREFVESRWLLEKASSAPVVGFRAPQFDMNGRSLELLSRAGYAYDASGCPTPVLIETRIIQWIRLRDPSAVLRLGALPFTWDRTPHVRHFGDRTLHEFPLSVTPWQRRPLHHSLRFSLGDARFERILDGFVRRDEELSYLLHGIDVLGMTEDRVDRRMAGESGMKLPLTTKLDRLERTLRAIALRFETLPFRDRLTAV
jgi:peptidoglycan-N-acetylglucosamine deacetylase